MLLPIHNKYMLKSIGLITHQRLSEWVYIFYLDFSIAHFYHIIFQMSYITKLYLYEKSFLFMYLDEQKND